MTRDESSRTGHGRGWRARAAGTTARVLGLAALCGLAGSDGRPAAGQAADPPGVTVMRDVRYREGPSRMWRLDVARRAGEPDAPRPGIVVIHGGGWLEGDRSSFATRAAGVPGNIVEFAEHGFVAATVNYRLSGEAPFPAALEDCRAAVRWLRAHAGELNLDPDRIGAYGNSAGGHLALLLGLAGADADADADADRGGDGSSRVQAVVSDSGPVDLLHQYEHDRLRGVVARFLGGPPEGDRVAAYRRASPRHWVAPGAPPVLLIYGVDDEQVPVETADSFVAALARAGNRDVTYLRLARVGHCPHSLVRVPVLRTVVVDFFTRALARPGR